jgi:glycosyltransferase involved in cell wall biosynthesis
MHGRRGRIHRRRCRILRPMPDPTPEVSVIIPCKDDTYLAATLDSLALQRAAPSFEVVVVDGFERDLARRLAPWTNRLTLRVVRPTGQTAGAQRNSGARASTAPRLLFVDADDTVDGSYVRAMTSALGSHDFVCSRVDVLRLNPDAHARGISLPQETGVATGMSFLPYAAGGTIGIARRLFEEIGGFDPSPMIRPYEDADLCWRIQLAGGDPPTFVRGAELHYRLERDPMKRFRKAVTFGMGQAALYARHRHSGMPRESIRDALSAWVTLPLRLYRQVVQRSTQHVLQQATVRAGRLVGSIRFRVLYL